MELDGELTLEWKSTGISSRGGDFSVEYTNRPIGAQKNTWLCGGLAVQHSDLSM